MRYDWLDEYLLQKRGVTKDLWVAWILTIPVSALLAAGISGLVSLFL